MQTRADAIVTVQASPWVSRARVWLVLDATECCVHIRIMRLEPISERTPQHTRGGARRATFHYVVLAVKEVRGITRIKRHRRKSRKRCELRPCPLPPVPHKILHAESARSRGMRPHRQRVPRFEIEVSPRRARRFLAPRIPALLLAVWRSIRGAMKLRLRRQFAPQPFRIRRGFRMANVNRPLLRQTDLSEHGAINPKVALARPEHRMLAPLFRFPGPRFVAPERTVLVTPRLYESQEIVVRHVMVVDGELVHRHFM